MRTSILASLLILVLTCCSSKRNTRLETIDVLLDDSPEYALELLEEMRGASGNPESGNKKQKAKCALLYAIALDKCYVDTTDVTVILPAVDYYSRHGSASDKKRMHYYYGRILDNGGRYDDAVIEYEKALAYTEEDEHYFLGLLYSSIGHMYMYSHNDRTSLGYMQQSLDSFIKTGDEENVRKAKYSLGIVRHNLRDYGSADTLFREALGPLVSLKGRGYIARVFARNLMTFDNPRYEEAVGIYSMMLNQGIAMTAEDKVCYAYALLLNGDTATAGRLLSEIGDIPDDYKSQVWRRRIAVHEGDYELAQNLIEKILSYEDKYVKSQLEQSLYKTQEDYYRVEAEKLAQDKRISILSTILTASVFVVVISVLCLMISIRARKVKEENNRLVTSAEESSRLLATLEQNIDTIRRREENNNHRIQELESNLTSSTEMLSQMRISYVQLFRKQFEQIINVFDPNRSVQSRDVRDRLYRSIDDMLESLSDPSAQERLERIVDSNVSGIITSIKKDFPKLTSEDIRFICYMIMGFDNTSISVLLNISKENVRVKRHRLRSRILDFENGKYHSYQAFFVNNFVTGGGVIS